eukprot:4515368-Amphidinium_carterae.1
MLMTSNKGNGARQVTLQGVSEHGRWIQDGGPGHVLAGVIQAILHELLTASPTHLPSCRQFHAGRGNSRTTPPGS